MTFNVPAWFVWMVATVIMGFIIIVMGYYVPPSGWRLGSIKRSRDKAVCLVVNDSGMASVKPCTAGPNWINVDNVSYPIAELKDSSGKELAVRRYVLGDVKKPLWIIYEPKGVAVSPEHLKAEAVKKAVKPALILDPADVKEDLKLGIHKSVLAYIMRNSELAVMEELKAFPMKALILIGALVVLIAGAVAIVYLVMHQHPEVIQYVNATHTVTKHLITSTATRTPTPPPTKTIPA